MFNAPPVHNDLAASLIAALPDGVVARDAGGRIVEVNPRFCQLSGYSRDELLDRPAPFPFESDEVLVRKDGARVAVSVSTGRLDRGGTCSVVRESQRAADEEPNRAVLDPSPAHERQLAGLAAQVDLHRRRVDELVASVPGVVWEARATPGEGPGLRMQFVSAYVERMLGYTVEQWLGAPDFWLSIVHPSDRDRVARETADALAAGRGMRIDFRWTRKDGKRLWVEATSTVIFDEVGRPIGLRGVTVDVTAQRRARRALKRRAQELAQLARDLKKSNEELDQFAYIASHDLRAPLRGIANLSRWIEEDLGDAITHESRQQMELLRGRVNRMETLITGLLEYSRVGRVKTAPETVDIGRLLAEIVDLLAPRAGATVEIGSGMPVLRTRKLPLQQVLMNLIGNALKHNNAAQPHVRVTARRIGGRGAPPMWEFAVADNGPGIAPEYHGRIFVIFQTLQARDKVEGAGMGLSLVKKIVETEGGTIRVDSREGAGATFTFTWPETPKGGA